MVSEVFRELNRLKFEFYPLPLLQSSMTKLVQGF